MLKKVFAIVLVIALCFSLAGCGLLDRFGNNSEPEVSSSAPDTSDGAESSDKTESTESSEEAESSEVSSSNKKPSSNSSNTSSDKHKHVYDDECDDTCNECKEKRTAPHKYKNDCAVICDLCYAARTPKDHVYDNACDETCNSCGMKRGSSAPHVYTNDCDGECNSCKKTRDTNHGKSVDTYGFCKACGGYTGETGDVNCWTSMKFGSTKTKYFRVERTYAMLHNIKFNGSKTFNYKAFRDTL